MKYDGFCGPAYRAPAKIAGSSTCINLLMEWSEARKQFALFTRPGFAQLGSTFATAPCGGLFAGDNRLWTVMGSTLYEVFEDGTTSTRGDVGTASGLATMVVNGNQLMVVNAGKVYIDTGTVLVTAKETLATGTVDTSGTAVTWVSGSDFTGIIAGDTITIGGASYADPLITYIVQSVTDATHLVLTTSAGVQTGVEFGIFREITGATGTFLDGYFVVAVPNSKTWRWSALNDGLTWDPLDQEQKEGYPDNISRIIAHDRYLWIFGFQTTEIWENSGNPPPASPFSRVSFIPHGCPSPYAPAEVGPTSIMWLSGSQQGMATVMRADSVQPIRVSTHALEYAMSTYSTLTDAEGYADQFRGHFLFVLTFPTAGKTWVYDLTSSQAAGEPIWTQYAAFMGGQYARYRGRCHAFVQGWNGGAGMHVLGDYQNGVLWEESPSFLNDGGEVRKRERTAPMLLQENQRITIWRMELIAQTGEISSGEYIVMAEWSFDEGETFGNVHEVSAGSVGEFGKRIILRQCGTGRRPVLRLTTTSEVNDAWTDVILRADVADA